MIKAALERMFNYGVASEENQTLEIDGRFYTQKDLELIEPPRYEPRSISVCGLDALILLIKHELDKVQHPVFVEVETHARISVYTTYGERYERQNLYCAKTDVPDFRFEWKDYESAMIAFRSRFHQDDGVAYVLDLLSKITDENSVKNQDNGIAQTVEVKRGTSLKQVENIKPIVTLRPYRTFLEVEQPASEFLLRLQEGGNVGLFEADGGMWRLTAKRTIKDYLEKAFADTPDVVVMV